jgi:hypothetical protein
MSLLRHPEGAKDEVAILIRVSNGQSTHGPSVASAQDMDHITGNVRLFVVAAPRSEQFFREGVMRPHTMTIDGYRAHRDSVQPHMGIDCGLGDAVAQQSLNHRIGQ